MFFLNNIFSFIFVLLFGLSSTTVFSADDAKEHENFFAVVLGVRNEPVIGPIFIKESHRINKNLQNWLTVNAGRIVFSKIELIPVKQSREKDIKKLIRFERMKKNGNQLVRLTKSYPNQWNSTLLELIRAIDADLPDLTFDEALCAARAFRHIINFNAQKLNPLGDFIAYYILDQKIAKAHAPISRVELGQAYYEMSQFYSHLLDFYGDSWVCDAIEPRLDMSEEFASSVDGRSTPLMPIARSQLLESKIGLLKYSIWNDINNSGAWIRAMELAFFDLPNGRGPCDGQYCQVKLSMDFDIAPQEPEIMNLVLEKYLYFTKERASGKNSIPFVSSKLKGVIDGLTAKGNESIKVFEAAKARKRKATEAAGTSGKENKHPKNAHPPEIDIKEGGFMFEAT